MAHRSTDPKVNRKFDDQMRAFRSPQLLSRYWRSHFATLEGKLTGQKITMHEIYNNLNKKLDLQMKSLRHSSTMSPNKPFSEANFRSDEEDDS